MQYLFCQCTSTLLSCSPVFKCNVVCIPLYSWQVLENYNKGKTALLSAAKIMVSPTELDLNPETLFMDTTTTTTSQQPTPTAHHRRNSSVRLVHQALLILCIFSFPLIYNGANCCRGNHGDVSTLNNVASPNKYYCY